MKSDPNCVFCKIVAGVIPSAKVYEDDQVLAFLDIAPFNFGHTVVIPKEHFQSYTVISPEYLSAMFAAAQKIAPAIMRVTGAEGFNLLLNNGTVAGQVVQHAHLHIIPRSIDDGFALPAAEKQYAGDAMAEMAAAIQSKIVARGDA